MSDLVTSVYEIFSAALRADVGPGANFFALGGDSLAAVEVATRIEDELGVDFPLEQLFANGEIDDVIAVMRTK